MRKRLIIVLFFATLHSASFSAFAGFDDGDAASKGGDYIKALKEFRELAAHGDARAQHRLGSMYDEGHGMPKDSIPDRRCETYGQRVETE